MSAEDLARLIRHAESRFALAPGGRMLAEGAPDNGTAPRLFFGGSADGNLLHLRHDVDDETARDLEALCAEEPPWTAPETSPRCLGFLIERLSRTAPAQAADTALIYDLPHDLDYPTDAAIVRTGTRAGAALLAGLAETGMPPHLVQAGFVGLGDFWEPWCAALVEGQIAALAFAARLGEHGADIGVHTFSGFRGRGLAAAVTAAWSGLPRLSRHTLFYSTHRANRSSQRVAARLGLRRFAVSVCIG